MFKISCNKTVLDLGCGTGTLLMFLSTLSNNTIGLEIDLRYLRNVSCLKSRVDLLNSDGRKLPLRSKSVDVVFCIGVLEHIPDVTKCLSEVRRVLRNRGCFIVSSPIVSEWGPLLLRWILQNFVDFGGDERVSIRAIPSSFNKSLKKKRRFHYKVGKDRQYGHEDYDWRNMLGLVQKYFRLKEIKFFPLHRLGATNPYVFFTLVK